VPLGKEEPMVLLFNISFEIASRVIEEPMVLLCVMALDVLKQKITAQNLRVH
jgi:hypothetical protein